MDKEQMPAEEFDRLKQEIKEAWKEYDQLQKKYYQQTGVYHEWLK